MKKKYRHSIGAIILDNNGEEEKSKKSYKNIEYHVFADYYDEWFPTLKEAKLHYREIKQEGYENIRLYKEIRDDNSELLDEYCLQSCGSYPE